jgi:hypothetical protein
MPAQLGLQDFWLLLRLILMAGLGISREFGGKLKQIQQPG